MKGLRLITEKQMVCDEVGHNCFYIMKLLENEEDGCYYLVSRSGVLNDPHRYGKEKFLPSRNPQFREYETAKKEFFKIIKEKCRETRTRTYRSLDNGEILINKDGLMILVEEENIFEDRIPHFIDQFSGNYV